MSNLALRILFGSLYVGVIISCLFFKSPYFECLMALAIFFSVREIALLTPKNTLHQTWIIPTTLGLIVPPFIGLEIKSVDLTVLVVLWMLQVICLAISYVELKKNTRLHYGSLSLYLFVPLFSLALWFNLEDVNHSMYLLFYFVTVWTYDSLAYVVGKLIGKRPMFPSVSPKKTIEGTIGGTLLTAIILFGLNLFWFHLNENALILVCTIVFFAIWGDFIESYMKRKIGIKDSGNLIPGHGGILDRMDSIYLSILPYLVILELFN